VFRENNAHLQMSMFNSISSLPENELTLLEESWANTFYHEFFCRLDESSFAGLYSDSPSRPNVPINILMALEVLKAGFGWSDEEMMHAFYFNLQVRYALGLHELGEGHFDIRTIYNFRQRLGQHMQDTGEDLIAQAFEQVTDEQMAAFALKTNRARMDSTFVASNIREMSRLQLLVEVMQRVHRMVSEIDGVRYADEFAPYLKGSSGQYVYRVRSEEGAGHIQRLGEVMHRLVHELATTYGNEPTYQVLTRVFHEHFILEEGGLRSRRGGEFPSPTVQSPDDLEASFRRKRGRGYRGFVVNVSETCEPDNDMQLIVEVQTEANVTDDPTLLTAALPALQERLDMQELYTDGGYNSRATVQLASELDIDHVQTAIRGHSSQGLGLEAFAIETTTDGLPTDITCPHGQRVSVKVNDNQRYGAHFDAKQCEICPHRESCPTRPLKRKPLRALYFSQHDQEIARRRQRIRHDKQQGRNLRAAVESTVAAIKRPFRRDKLPVRGLRRMAAMMIASASMVNIRRIHRHQVAEGPQGIQSPAAVRALSAKALSFLLLFRQLRQGLHLLCTRHLCPAPIM